MIRLKQLKYLTLSGLLAGLLLCLPGCGRTPETLVVGGPTMGTTWSVRIVAVPGLPGTADIERSLSTRLSEINAVFSTYLESSELSRFNRSEHTDWVPVSPELVDVVEAGRSIYTRSDGAFDVTVGPLVNLWGFGPDGQPELVPAAADIERLLADTGYGLVETRRQPPAMRKHRAGVYVDLSAIAKGYAVDQLAQLLDQLGASAYLVEVGGELRSRGTRADGRDWRVAVESPLAGTRQVLRVVGLRDRSMATSGDYRNFFELDGRRYSHTIDPRTGWPVDHGLAAVNVSLDDCMSADAWATALLVLGLERGLQLAREGGLAANFLSVSDDEVQQRMTPAYQRLAEPGP